MIKRGLWRMIKREVLCKVEKAYILVVEITSVTSL